MQVSSGRFLSLTIMTQVRNLADQTLQHPFKARGLWLLYQVIVEVTFIQKNTNKKVLLQGPMMDTLHLQCCLSCLCKCFCSLIHWLFYNINDLNIYRRLKNRLSIILLCIRVLSNLCFSGSISGCSSASTSELPVFYFNHPADRVLTIGCPGARPNMAVAWDRGSEPIYRFQHAAVGDLGSTSARLIIDSGHHLVFNPAKNQDSGTK